MHPGKTSDCYSNLDESGKPLIERPTLLFNKRRAFANIERMARKAKASEARFRPHFKTHQSAQVGEWLRKFDIESIALSSVDMALYFAENGSRNITIAFPANIDRSSNKAS